MKKYLFILLIIFSVLLSAQTTNKHITKQVEYAKELIAIGDYKNAYNNLIEVQILDSLNPEINYYLAYSLFYSNRDKQLALPYFEIGKTYNGNAYYFIGVIQHQKKEFKLAKKAFNEYKSIVIEEKLISSEEIQKALDRIDVAKELIRNKTKLEVYNLGENINSAYPDYAPILFANANKLFYTSRKKGSFPDIKDPNNEYFEDIYYSEKVNDKWEASVNLGQPLNSKTHDASIAISPDEKTLYLYRTNASIVGGDVLVSTKTDNKWSEPQLFESTINTKTGTESSISISPKGDVIYFSSNRAGGYGGKDIYSIKKLPNGSWALPVNLGGMINTEEDEDAPFISSNDTSLYFASKAHKNMGGYDLFKTELLTNGKWSEPENLGYPVNSVRDDIFISTVDDLNYFFSSNRDGGYGFSDIYQTVFPKEKNKYLVLKGRVINSKNGKSLRANITLFNKSNNKLTGIYKSDLLTGKFIMVLKPDEEYKMFVEVKGYYNQTLQVDLTKKLKIEDILRTIRMIEVKNNDE